MHGNNSSEKNPTRKVIIFKRWFDIIILSFIASLIYLVASLFLKPSLSEALSIFGIFPIWIQCPILILMFTLLWLPVIPYGSFSKKSFLPSIFFRYPPFWIACIFSLLTIIFLQPYIAIISGERITLTSPIVVLDAFAVVIVGAAMAVGYSTLIHWHTSSCVRRQENHEVETLQPVSEDSKALFQWIKEERPIETNDQDRLN